MFFKISQNLQENTYARDFGAGVSLRTPILKNIYDRLLLYFLVLISSYKVHEDLKFSYNIKENLKIWLHFLWDFFQKVREQFLSKRLVLERFIVPKAYDCFWKDASCTRISKTAKVVYWKRNHVSWIFRIFGSYWLKSFM